MKQLDNINKDLFAKFLSGNTTEEEKLVFEQWLNHSEDNRNEFHDFAHIWHTSGMLKEYDLDNARRMVSIKILEKLKTTRGFVYYWQRIAAILIIPLLIYSVWPYIKAEDAKLPVTTEVVKTPYGARTSFILPDGSTAWLNAGSELSYPHVFGKAREVSLKGEIYLEVKKSKKPFVVKTMYGEVMVHGTKFNVNAFAGEPFQTTLVEGSVSIKNKTCNEEVILKPGSHYTSENGKYKVEKNSPDLYTSWKDGKMVFRREPFIQVAKRLERWFNVKIQLEGETIKNLWYTGTIEMESFSEVLELIKNTTPITYKFNNQTRILTITAMQ